MAVEFVGIFPARVSAATLERSPTELDSVENGALFIPWPKPPRVGAHVQIELAFGEAPSVRVAALVVSSRPARGTIMGGFSAQLESPPPQVRETLRGLVETVRRRLLTRALRGPEAVPDAPIRERIRAKPTEEQGLESLLAAPRTGLLAPPLSRPPAAPVTSLPPPRRRPPAAPAPHAGPHVRALSIDLPDDDGSSAAYDFRAEPDEPLPPPGTRAIGLAVYDLSVYEDEPPAAGEEPPEPDLEAARRAEPLPVELPPVRITFASARTYRLHFERFLHRGEIYCTQLPAPAAGTPLDVVLEVPDGLPPLVTQAIVDREVAPPEVPRAGYVATLYDADGTVALRLEAALDRLVG